MQGLPWWSRGQDSELPLKGAQVQSLKILSAEQQSQNEQKQKADVQQKNIPEKQSRKIKKKSFAKILKGNNFLIYSTNTAKRQTEKQTKADKDTQTLNM